MTLSLDTTQPLSVTVRLDDFEKTQHYDRPQEQDILALIDAVLKTKSVSLSRIQSIKVNPGPGSFTGTRVGVTIANALAFALNVPVNDQKPPIFPQYSQPPNITLPRRQ